MYKGITKNSKEVKEGYIYCCFEGANFNGYDYIQEALNLGAKKIIGTKKIELEEYERVLDVSEAMNKYAKQIYHNPQKKIKLIGITGTDGKTSTALIIDTILNKLSSSSYLGTNGYYIGQEEIEYTGFTTPFGDAFYKYLRQSVDAYCKYFVLEVSSHSLKQKRLGSLKYDSAIFTNLTKEHLDYHKTMEDYYQSKKLLFLNLKDNTEGIINIDDEYGRRLYKEVGGLTISSINPKADFYFEIQELKLNGTKIKLTCMGKEYNISSPLIAKFNAYNLISAIACVWGQKYSLDEIISCVDSLLIPGRLESVPNKLGMNIIIDFAHTSEAIKKVMEFINTFEYKGKVFVLTGSAGGRDKQKRPLMGLEAARYTDYLFLTEDDPRDEDVKQINQDLRNGIENDKCIVIEEVDRKKAIRKMINLATSGDTLILFGKGAMKVMYYNKYTEEYIEKEVIEEILKEGKYVDNN